MNSVPALYTFICNMLGSPIPTTDLYGRLTQEAETNRVTAARHHGGSYRPVLCAVLPPCGLRVNFYAYVKPQPWIQHYRIIILGFDSRSSTLCSKVYLMHVSRARYNKNKQNLHNGIEDNGKCEVAQSICKKGHTLY